MQRWKFMMFTVSENNFIHKKVFVTDIDRPSPAPPTDTYPA